MACCVPAPVCLCSAQMPRWAWQMVASKGTVSKKINYDALNLLFSDEEGALLGLSVVGCSRHCPPSNHRVATLTDEAGGAAASAANGQADGATQAPRPTAATSSVAGSQASVAPHTKPRVPAMRPPTKRPRSALPLPPLAGAVTATADADGDADADDDDDDDDEFNNDPEDEEPSLLSKMGYSRRAAEDSEADEDDFASDDDDDDDD